MFGGAKVRGEWWCGRSGSAADLVGNGSTVDFTRLEIVCPPAPSVRLFLPVITFETVCY